MNGINLISANEFSLVIALTAFVAITIVLVILLIALGASKNFRTVFFREKKSKTKKKKAEKAAAVSEPAEFSEPSAVEPQKPARTASSRKRGNTDPEYLNAIPTVPLGGIPQITPTPSNRRSSARMRTEFEAVEEQPRATYTTRSVTITRARSSSLRTEPTETENAEPQKRSTKKR